MLPNPVAYHIYTGEPLPSPSLYTYILAGQGVVKWGVAPHFSAAIPLQGCKVAGLPLYPEGVVLNIPRIPAKWLYLVLDHARHCGQGIEQMYHFHWLAGQGWRVAVPRQQASAGQVSYHGGTETTVVLDLHSHHGMNAFFSGTDNRDEQGLRFYGVIGKIYSRPELILRVGVYGDWLELDPLELFDGLGPFTDSLTEEDPL